MLHRLRAISFHGERFCFYLLKAPGRSVTYPGAKLELEDAICMMITIDSWERRKYEPSAMMSCVLPWSVADPGFPSERQLQRRVRQPIIFQFFLPKTAWKWTNLDHEGGRVPGVPPLNPPLLVFVLCFNSCQGRPLHSHPPGLHARKFLGENIQ